MKKIVKWIGILTGMVVLLAILLVICLATFVSPNRFKPFIAEQIKHHTGRQVIMDGDLSWTFLPKFGIKTGHIALKNPAEFEQGLFAEVKDVTVNVRLIPLLRKKIEASGIKLDGMKLHLVKNNQGQVNWNFQSETTKELSDSTETHNNAKPSPMAVAILALDITNSEITWTDEQKRQFTSVEKLNIHAGDINLFSPFPLSADFMIVNPAAALKSEVNVKTDALLNMDAQVFTFRNFTIVTQIQKNKQSMRITLMGDVMADLVNQILQWENLSAKSGNLVLKGKISIANLVSNPVTTGHLQLEPFDVKKWLHDNKLDMTAVQVLKNMSGEIDFIPIPKSFGVKAKFFIDEVTTNRMKLTQLSVPMEYQEGVISLTPISASFYQGKWGGQVSVDFNTKKVVVFASLNHFNVASLMQDLKPKQQLTLAGEGNVDMQVNTLLGDKQVVLKNLNGSGHFNINKGVLQGMDINYLISTAKAVATKQEPLIKNTRQTPFNEFKGSFVIQTGVISNNDLVISAADFITKGQGTIDLGADTIDYHLQTSLSQNDNAQNRLAIPIRINGGLAAPHIGLDREAITKAVADQQIQKVKSQLQDRIEKGKLPEKAGKFLQNLLGH